jgi:epoxyqueuosine reductase
MRRNACIVLGNRGDAGAIPALREASQDADPVVAEHARWAIARIENRKR